MAEEVVKRYSQAFKQPVVREYEAGSSESEVRQKYGVGGHGTVKRWVKQYRTAGYRSEVVRIQTVADHAEVQAMRQRIRELEAALAESVLDTRMLRTTLDVASQTLGLDLKKKFGSP